MVTTWTARAAALLGLVAWALKDFAILAAGGPGKGSLEEPLWVVGIILEVVACLVLGAVVAGIRESGPAARIGGGVIGIAVGAVVIAVCRLATSAATPQSWGWFRGESGLLVGALIVFAATYVVHDSRRRGRRKAKRRDARAQAEADAEAARLEAARADDPGATPAGEQPADPQAGTREDGTAR